jgi:DNA-binding beta-propeller fold protein YncE
MQKLEKKEARKMIGTISIVIWSLLTMAMVGITSLADTALAQEKSSVLRANVYTLTDSIVGGAAGLSIDQMGVVYAGTFDDRVYKVRMDGRPEVFASGLYGATGNVVGPMGNLYQLNFFGGYITKIDRHGNQVILARDLNTPVAVTLAEGDLYVANCGSNSISRVTLDGKVTTLLQGPPFNCPNGITYASDSNLYVVNFSDKKLLRVTLQGKVTELSEIPHDQNVIASARGYLYIASGSGRQLHRVSLATKEITHIAGTGERGSQDGDALDATFNYPNGIAATGEGMIFVHDITPPAATEGIKEQLRTASIRIVSLPSLTDELSSIYVKKGANAMVEAYNRYRADPATAGLLDEAEVNGWGHATLPVLPEAGIKILQLNAESYPNSWRVYNALGDAYTRIGQSAEAIAAFERSLEINPNNMNAVKKIKELRKKD